MLILTPGRCLSHSSNDRESPLFHKHLQPLSSPVPAVIHLGIRNPKQKLFKEITVRGEPSSSIQVLN